MLFRSSLVLVLPVSPEAKAWIEEHVDPEAQWFGRSLVVEPRYVEAILDGMSRDGLVLAA